MNKLIKRDLFVLLACAVVFALVQTGFSTRAIGAFWQLNIILICINIILASSLNLINGYTGQFSLGHAGFMAVGAYAGAVCTVYFHLPFVVSLIVGSVLAGVFGLIIGMPTLRLKGDYLAIATLGFGEIIRLSILNINYVGGASGLSGIPRVTNFAWAFWLMIGVLFIIKNLVNSTHGRACIAVRENEIAAEAMGINTTQYKVIAFTTGAVFAGLAGVLFAHYFYLVHPSSFTFMKSIDILTIVVLGGLGSQAGSIVGAIALTLISALLASYAEWRMIIYALLLIVIMIFRPQGLLGDKELVKGMMKRLTGGKQ